MKQFCTLLLTMLAALNIAGLRAADDPICKERFEIASRDLKLTLMVGSDNRLYQLGFGNGATEIKTPDRLPSRQMEFLAPYGNGVITEPAIAATHADGNTSTDLYYVSRETVPTGLKGVTCTKISLKDPAYPFFVDIYINCYTAENFMEIWNEIRHSESGVVTLYRYASAAPLFTNKNYWLTQFYGNYKREATLSEESLSPGIKILDSNLGVRTTQMRIPSFVLSLDGPARENEGEVFAASLKWSGNFQLAFDMDWDRNLRVLTGINPSGTQYRLKNGEVFRTPAILWAYSDKGKGETTRIFHRWANEYGIRDGLKDRPVLLNNWEATYCDFDENRLVALFDGARDVGAELFLLDDGWFGNKYVRDDDKQGLGDWEPSVRKLPSGLSYLATQAAKRGIGFGIWLEPEMVNPRSELYENHPDWVVKQEKRELLFGRNQLVLDLTRPEVQQFEWGIFQRTLGPNPGITYVKWDCNRYFTQPGSPYLKAEEQSELTIRYTWALYDLMDKFATQFPNVMGMVCSGGGGRVDYGSMRYFHSFWPSDNTDPLGRIKIQWGFGHFFPATTMAAHVTRMGKRHLKLAIDVALSGAFGIDMALDKATPEERAQLTAGVKLYKDRLRDLVLRGELYRLESPYEGPVAALSYVSKDKKRAAVYIYQNADGNVPFIRLNGLSANGWYKVQEVNLPAGEKSRFAVNGKTVSGAELMLQGIANPLSAQFESAVLEITAQ